MSGGMQKQGKVLVNTRQTNADVPGGDVRIAQLMPIPDVLRELRCDPDAVLAAAGFDAALFGQPDMRVPYRKAAALLRVCAEASRMPHFGLLLAARFNLLMLGTLEPLMRNCDNVHIALQQLIRHLHLNDRGAAGYLTEINHDEIALGYSVYGADVPGIGQVYDLVIATICGILRSLCGTGWQPNRILLAHDAPADLGPYHQFFRAPLHFNAARAEVVFAKRWLDHALEGADPSRLVAAERLALSAERAHDQHFVVRVRRSVQVLLMAGEVSAAAVCSQLGVHERVLRRHLHAQGTSVKQIIGQARFETACQLLGNTQLSVTEIAAALSYSDVTAFSRAFRNWSGLPPEHWRRRASGLRATAPPTSAARTPVGTIPD